MAAGFCHVVALTSSGQVYAWGQNQFCQVAEEDTDRIFTPVPVSANLEGKFVTSVACGFNHTLALTDQGEVYGWGYNKQGRIIGVTSADQRIYIEGDIVLAPVKIRFPCEIKTKIVSISAGRHFSVALTDNGQVRSEFHQFVYHN